MKNYSVPGDYFEHIIQKHETFDDNPSIQIKQNRYSRVLYTFVPNVRD